MCFFKKIKQGQVWIKEDTIGMYQEEDMDEVIDVYGKWVKYKSGITGNIWVESKKDFCLLRHFYKNTQ